MKGETKMDTDEKKDLIRLYLTEVAEALESFPVDEVEEATSMVESTYEQRGCVYACGCGGNGSVVSNLITDLSNHLFVADDKTKPLPEGIPRLRTYNLVSSGESLTATANDLGRRYMFSQQLVNDRIGEGDLLFGFSGSGGTDSVLEAFEVAKRHGAKTIAVTRNRESPLVGLADHVVVFEGTSQFPGQVASNDFNFHYEGFSFDMGHIIVGLLKEKIRRENYP